MIVLSLGSRILGGLLFVAAVGAGLLVWIATVVGLFNADQTLLALVAIVVPPADIPLAFLVSVPLGVVGLLIIPAWLAASLLWAAGEAVEDSSVRTHRDIEIPEIEIP